MRNLSHNFEDNREHPPPEEFLMFVDGELPPNEVVGWNAHLDACWNCRTRVAEIEQRITEFVRFENTVSHLQLSRVKTTTWGNFRKQLNGIDAEVNPRTILDRLHELWRHTEQFRLLRVAVPSLAALVVVALIYQYIFVAPVSAAEILNRSIAAQETKIGETVQPVLHQRIRVRRAGQAGVISWEIWNDTVNSRVRVKSSGEWADEPNNADAGVVRDVQQILRANRMNEHRPLSAASYQAWSHSLTAKTEGVEKNGDTLTIHTVPNQTIPEGSITEARLLVRSADYHPTALYMSVRTATSQQWVELVEQVFEIVSLKNVDPSIFADTTKLEAASTVGAKLAGSRADVAPALGVDLSNTNTAAPPNMPKASSAEEVEVLDLLNRVGADITEQLNVTRTADGRLLIEGLVESERRKTEILAALSPVSKKPAIRIKIQTIEEAAKALARQKAQATPGSVERIEVEKGVLAVDAELREHFGRQGGDIDGAIRRYAARAIDRSQSAALHASALNRMAGRFNAEELKALEPNARAKWLNILKRYAATVRRDTAALRVDLNSVFGGFDAGGGESVTSDADLIETARRLFTMAADNDRVIRSAFALSSGGASVSAVKTAQFRQSIAQAEALAAALERAK